MKRSLLVAFMIASATVGGCSLHPNDNTLPGQAGVGSDGYTTTVTFDRVENLVPNSTVQRQNVVIGTVAKIKVVDWQAQVTLRLLKSVKLPANSTFSIGQKTLLGAQYVQVDEPAKPKGQLKHGSTVGVANTGAYPATEQVLASASLLLNNGGLSQLTTITGELNETLDGRVPDTRDVIKRLDALLGTLDSNKTELVGTLEALNRLSGKAAEQKKTVATALETLAPGIDTLTDKRRKLVATATALGETSVTASALVAANQRALLANLGALRPILGALDGVADQVPDALKLGLSIPFPIMTTGDAVKGDYANLFATIDLSPEALANSFLKLGLEGPGLLDPLGSLLAPGPSVDPAKPGAPKPSSGAPAGGAGATPAPPAASVSPGTPEGAEPGSSCGLLGLLGLCR